MMAVLLCWICSTATAQAGILADSLLAHVRELASDAYEGRATEKPGNLMAADYILARFEHLGLKAFATDYVHPFQFYSRFTRKAYLGRNLIAYLPGSANSGKHIVLSAHYDHVGIRKGEIYNGADDNASGIGALIEIARCLKDHPIGHNVIFAAFDAEEVGLRGAGAFIENPPVPLDSILLNINMDMVSRSAQNELYVCGTHYTPVLRDILQTVEPAEGLAVLFGHEPPAYSGADDWTLASDHGKFHQADIPFLYFGVEDHEDYHQPTDDYSGVMPDFYLKAVDFVLRSLIDIDRSVR